MATKKKKAVTGSERVRLNHRKNVRFGLRVLKVWVSDNPDNVEADRIRNYAAKLPETKHKRKLSIMSED